MPLNRTAQHCTTPPAQSRKPSTRRSEYVSKEICTCMHAASRLFSWSVKLLAFASRLFAPKMLDHLLLTTSVCHSNPFPLASERSGRKGAPGYGRTWLIASVGAGSIKFLFVSHPAAYICCLLYTSPSPRDKRQSRMPSSA